MSQHPVDYGAMHYILKFLAYAIDIAMATKHSFMLILFLVSMVWLYRLHYLNKCFQFIW